MTTPYHHILVPTDGSPLALKGAQEAVSLAQDLHARLTAIYVAPPWQPPYSDESSVVTDYVATRKAYEQGSRRDAEAALAAVEGIAKGANVPCDRLSITDGSPWESIVEAADAQHCDLIVMGSHGRGYIGQVLLGSQTTQVLNHSKTPVLVCR